MKCIERILKNYRDFTFFQCIRLIRLSHQKSNLNFRSTSKISYTDYEIEKIKLLDQNSYEITTSFLGLSGPHSHLNIDDQIKINNSPFLSAINHRLIELSYLAWEMARPYIEDEWLSEKNHMSSAIERFLMSIAGINDRSLLYYAGFSLHRSAYHLKAILESYFRLPFAIHNIPLWQIFDNSHDSALGNALLGRNSILGNFFYNTQGHLLISVGPLHFVDYLQLLPHQPMYSTLQTLLQWFIGPSLSYQIITTLMPEEAPTWHLGNDDPAQLGWTTYLCSR